MRKEEFIKTLSGQAPEGCNFKVGNLVEWINDYGVVWRHEVLGFKDGMMFLDTDSWWFPMDYKKIKKVIK